MIHLHALRPQRCTLVPQLSKLRALASDGTWGDKPQKHSHYLKGTVFCGRCGSRLLFSRNTGKSGGTYDYFACLTRHRRGSECDLPWIQVQTIELAVERHYAAVDLDKDAVEILRRQLMKAAERRNATVRRMAKRDRKRVLELEAKRRKLLDGYVAGAVPVDLLREQQEQISSELASAQASLANAEVDWAAFQANLSKALDLVRDMGEMYRRASPKIRRYLNQAIIEAVFVDAENGESRVELAEPFRSLTSGEFRRNLSLELKNPGRQDGQGSNNAALVEVLGRYSNHCDQGKRIERVLEIPLSEPTTPVSKPLRKVHRRLQAHELDQLAEAYLAGSTLAQLSDRFRKHPSTISTDLERRGVARRYRIVEGERLHLAIQSYQDGQSVVSIGKELGVADETVRKALIQAGVKLRPRRGWED